MLKSVNLTATYWNQ